MSELEPKSVPQTFTIIINDGSEEVVHHTAVDPYIIRDGTYQSTEHADVVYPIKEEQQQG